MKNFLTLLLFAVFILVLFNYLDKSQILSFSLCDSPIRYRVDTVDPKFNLTRDQFLSDTNRAAQIWNQAENKNLFIYDPDGKLSINLIYDERQSLTTQVGQLENKVKSDQGSLKPQISQYENMVLDFKGKLAQLNKDIEYWNSRGGAPKEEYDKFIQRQNELKGEASKLNAMAENLNVTSEQYNQEVDQLNQTIYQYNTALSQRPEEGIYKGGEDRIEIYFNISQNELIHTLAHELGHALGLGHINNPNAIMFAKTNQKISLTNEDLASLGNLCRKRSYFELLQNYIQQFTIRLRIR